MRLFFCVFLLLIFTGAFAQRSSRIAFGSCSHEHDNDQMWPDILADKPDLFIWTGDIVYGDTHDMKILRKKYAQQKNRRSYQSLIKQVPVIGVWDDHDYGVNDGGKNYTKKDASKEALLEFLDVSQDDAVRHHQGVYSAHDFESDGKKVNIILLDCRYFRDTLRKDMDSDARYKINEKGDILGDAQWQWLEEQLSRKDMGLNIIVSGIQVLANEHGFEKWGNFPQARTRLIELISNTNTPTFIISGDRHIAELSKLESSGLPYPLYDFTASGLTHTWSRFWEEENKLRTGELIIQKNYGLLDIQWNKERPQVTFIVKGKNGIEYQSHSHIF